MTFITNPAPEFEQSPEEYFEPLKPIYSLASSKDRWNRNLNEDVWIKMKMIPNITYYWLYSKLEDN